MIRLLRAVAVAAGCVVAVGIAALAGGPAFADRTVIVRCSPVDGPGTASSIDRHYGLGLRYEFHPADDTGPYRDSICSATHLVAAPSPTASPTVAPPTASPTVAPPTASPTVAPASRPAGAAARWWRGGLGLLLVIGAGVGVWLVGRRRQR